MQYIPKIANKPVANEKQRQRMTTRGGLPRGDERRRKPSRKENRRWLDGAIVKKKGGAL